MLKNFKVIIVFTAILISNNQGSAAAAEVLSWKDCLREAAKNNADIKTARENVIQNFQAKNISASSLLPQINASAGASSQETSASGNSNSFNYGVSVSQLLFDGRKTGNNVQAANANITAAKESYKFTSSLVRFQLRQAFINLLNAQELLELVREIYAIRENNLKLIQLRYKSGTEHKGAMLTAEANLSQAGLEIRQAERGMVIAQRQLNNVMGRDEFLSVTAKDTLNISIDYSQEPDVELIAHDNPSLLQAVARKNSAEFSLKADRSDFFPSLSFSGGVSKSNIYWPPDDNTATAGLSLSWSIFEGGARLARIKSSESIYRQREQEVRTAFDSVTLELASSWRDFKDAVETVDVQKAFLNAAEERSKISEQQYGVGLISFDNWTIIEDGLVSAKKSYLNAKINAMLTEAGWIRAKGETIEYEN